MRTIVDQWRRILTLIGKLQRRFGLSKEAPRGAKIESSESTEAALRLSKAAPRVSKSKSESCDGGGRPTLIKYDGHLEPVWFNIRSVRFLTSLSPSPKGR